MNNNNTSLSSEMSGIVVDEYIYMASTTQQLIVSSIQIPTSILSLIGSSLIVVNVKSIRKRTPYRRILLMLSSCDIISTIGWLLQPFLADKQVPDAWVWSIGNHASCVMLGSLSQFGTPSAHLYSLVLAVYFLMTVRFGVKERNFEKKYERWIHASILIFSISTAIAGIFLGIFRPSILAPGCWISAPAEGCSEDCPEAKWAWFFGGLPAILTLFGISISNIMLYLHVRRTVMEGEKRALANEQSLASFQPPECAIVNNTEITAGSTAQEHSASIDFIEPITSNKPTSQADLKAKSQTSIMKPKSVLRSSDKQWKRVQEVGKQAFLYVGAYFLSFSWTFVLNYLDSIDYEYQRGSGNILFPLLLLQAIFAPVFGMFTCFIFFRPKYKAARMKFPDESRAWVFRQVVTGAADGRTPVTRPRSTTSAGSKPRRHRNKRKSSWATRINFAGERLSTGSFHFSSRILSNNGSSLFSNINHSTTSGGLHAIDESREESNKKDVPHNEVSLSNDTLRENGKVSGRSSSYKEEKEVPSVPRSSQKMKALDHRLINMSDDEVSM